MTLSKEQQSLISSTYDKIFNAIKGHEAFNSYHTNKNSARAASSFIVEAAQSYTGDTNDKDSFVKYAINICKFRLIDLYRSLNPHIRHNNGKKQIVKNIEKEIISVKQSCTQDDVLQKLYERGYNPSEYVGDFEMKRLNLSQVNNRETTKPSGLDQIDWEDTKQYALKLAEKVFKDNGRVTPLIYRTLIKEHLLPKCDGENYKSVREIATEFNKAESRISYLLHGAKMMDFWERVNGNN